MEKSVYLVWHLGSVIYVGSTCDLMQRRCSHITDAYGKKKVAGLCDYMRNIFNAGGRNRKFEFAFQEIYRGEDWQNVEEKTMKEMGEKYKLVNRSTLAVGNNSTVYKRIPPKVTREQIEKSIATRKMFGCKKTEKSILAAKKRGQKLSHPVIFDGVEFPSATACAAHIGTSIQTVTRTAHGSPTKFKGRITWKAREN